MCYKTFVQLVHGKLRPFFASSITMFICCEDDFCGSDASYMPDTPASQNSNLW